MGSPADGPQFRARRVAGRGPRRRRVALASIGLAAVVTVVVIKPWSVDAPAVPAASSGAESQKAAPAARADATLTTNSAPPAQAAVAQAIEPHDAWGVRAVVGIDALEELWLRSPLPMPIGAPARIESSSAAIVLSAETGPVRLLGVTTPPGVTPLAVRVSLVRPLGRTVPLAVRETRVPQPGNDAVLLAPADWTHWAIGVYHLRVDLGAGFTAMTVAII